MQGEEELVTLGGLGHMPQNKYRVGLLVSVEVEAQDLFEAGDKAIRLAESGTLNESFQRDSEAYKIERIEDEDETR